MIIALLPLPAPAANPQSYKVDFDPTGRDDIDTTIKATSQLQALRTTAPVDPYGLIARARGDVDRLKTVLESYGFYDGTVTITIEGVGLDDPRVGDALVAMSKGDARVRVSLALGPLFHVGEVQLEGEMPEADRAAFGLASGAPAVAADVLAAGSRLQSSLQDQGYAFAKVDPPVAYLMPDQHLLNITFKVETGPRVKVGEITITGLKHVKESVVRRRLLIHTGEPYSAAAVEKARRDLLTFGVFGSVSVRLAEAPDAMGRVPITFDLRERLRRTFSINGAYSSDLGGSGGLSWTNRNLLGNADELRLSGSIINVGGTASTGLGYDATARYTLPDFYHRDQSLQVSLSAIKQALQAYDQTAQSLTVTLSRKLSTVWTVSAALSGTRETIIQGEDVAVSPPVTPNDLCPADPSLPDEPVAVCGFPVTRDYRTFALLVTVGYDSTNLASPLDDPTHGFRASFSIAPTYSIGGTASVPVEDIPKDTTASISYCGQASLNLTEYGSTPVSHCVSRYLVAQGSIATYLDLHDIVGSDPGRKVIAVRALGGTAVGASWYDLSPDQRFYAGGSGTVRGYRYQSVGPTFSVTGNPQGGTSMEAVNLEYRQRFGMNWGAAVFADGGGVNLSPNPFAGVFRVGVGAGARYYTPIGPIHVDVAVPVPHRPGDDNFEIYIGLGQAF